MNLKKALLKFYKKSITLDELRITLSSLKKIKARVSKTETLSLNAVQAAIDHHSGLKEISDKIFKIPSELLGMLRDIIHRLKQVGVPVKKKIPVHDEKYGDLNFWFEGTYVYFEKA